jgi:hypothetical protein
MKTTIIILSTLLLILLIPTLYYGQRYAPWILFGTKMKRAYENTYAIQNVGTGKDIRVYNVGVDNETKIILYTHNEWECLTWQFIEVEDSTFLLKNLCTEKTFEPSSSPQQGVELWQQSLGGSRLQYWEFIEQPDETHLIRLKDTELYLTATSDEDNSSIILMPKQDLDKQLWRLIAQNPIYK